MLTLPNVIGPLLTRFAMLFTNPTWRKAELLLVGTILTSGQRTVAAALRVMGLSDDRNYARYHEVLNRAVWSPRAAARILLMLLLHHLDHGDGPLIFGIDETLERRRGAKIRARGIYRDAVRSSRHQLVKASGLRWISLMWLGHVPWAGRHRGLPVLTVLAPSSRYYQRKGRRAQEDHRLGPADGHAAASLATPSLPSVGGGQRLRRAGFAPLLPVSPRSGHSHRPIAPGRRSLRASAATSSRPKRPPAAERRGTTIAENAT